MRLIDADELKAKVEAMVEHEESINTLGNLKRYISGGGVTDRKANKAIDMAIEALQAEPKAEPKHGHWIERAKIANTDVTSGKIVFAKDFIKQERWNYCPYCGAKMDDDDNYRANRILDAADEYAKESENIRKRNAQLGGWIPCSEKLPNKEDLYMVTRKTFSDDYRFIDLFYYGKPLMPNYKVKGACWYRSDSEWGDIVYDDSDIIAWKPLPMPYREESEDKE